MSNCIIFSRVSTNKQERSQIDNVVSLARSCGYKDEDMFIIEEKESYIKLSEVERLGITRLKELIKTKPNTDCVFASEVSRLARTKKVVLFNRCVCENNSFIWFSLYASF